MKAPTSVASSDRAIWIVHEYLKSKVIFSSASNMPLAVTGGTPPAEVAKSSGMSKLEAELALRLLVEMGQARKRKDGRYFYAEPPRKEVTNEKPELANS